MNLHAKYSRLLKHAHSAKKKRWVLNKLRKYPPSVADTPSFITGDVVKITVDNYGVRYRNVKGVVVSHSPGTTLVQTARRKSPIKVQDEHLVLLNRAA